MLSERSEVKFNEIVEGLVGAVYNAWKVNMNEQTRT